VQVRASHSIGEETYLTLRAIPNVPPPAGASHVYNWDWDDAHTPVHHAFDLKSWDVDGDKIAVDLSGVQHADGSVRLEVQTHLPNGALTPDEARALGDALLAAAATSEQWTAANSAPRDV
jgi:hypothetical protein